MNLRTNALMLGLALVSQPGCAWFHQATTPHHHRALVIHGEGGIQIGDHPTPVPTFRFLWGYRYRGWLLGIGGRGTGRLTTTFPGRSDHYGIESLTWEVTGCRLGRILFGCGMIAAGHARGFRQTPGEEWYRSFSEDNPVLAFRLRGGVRIRVAQKLYPDGGGTSLYLEGGVDLSVYVTRQVLFDERGQLWERSGVDVSLSNSRFF